MARVGILHRWDPRNYLLFTHTLYPIVRWHRGLRNLGLEITFHTRVTPALLESDVVMVADYFPVHGPLGEDELAVLAGLKSRGAKVLFFDNRDSCGTTSFEVMDHVDRYCKKQLYRDRSHYSRSVYGLRTYAEFYHEKFGINDTNEESRLPLSSEHAHKLCLSWNLGLGIYELHSGILRRLNYYIYRNSFPIMFSFDRDILPAVFRRNSRPFADRSIDVHYRGRREYGLETIAFGRTKVDDYLGALKGRYRICSEGSVSRKKFARELANSKVVVSPFGYGEVCHRDFEAIASGCLLLKPSMEHLETWPDYYQPGKTYLPYSWDFSDFVQQLEAGLANHPGKEIARQAQELHKASFSTTGEEQFCRRFSDLCQF